MKTLKPKAQFIIGAAASGSGKTTFTLGLLRALGRRGMRVQPFKCGPDYLDTKHHAAAAGVESYNLDTFMASEEHVREVYAQRGAEADVCVTEGAMGLFDGYAGMRGSAGEVAQILGVPVVLVVSARSTAYSVAALLYGFRHFRPEVRIAGVVFNFVASERHYGFLQEACRDAGVEALGYLPKCCELEIPSRHLGLNVDSDFCFATFADRIADEVEKTINIERLLEVCQTPTPAIPTTAVPPLPEKGLCIAVARDEVFNFYYPENIRILEKYGKVIYFSPLHDNNLPAGTDFVYLPGGYPELHLPALAANESMRRVMRNYCLQGGHLLAECGGMMYLGDYIEDTEGVRHAMCGVLPQGATMQGMRLHLGYRKVLLEGQEFRGHEFHYSRIVPGKEALPSVARVLNAHNEEVDTPVYRLRNVMASYIHFYWADSPSLLSIAAPSL